ncbi:hypothetical protein ACJMK2_025366 [Sinanodonta woodiana]|uniref:Alpha-mannosidase n=1 Tax=Sinanodonta woodiana TaxID=1069815 RepID=A0ABD3XGS4_SINWO
MKKYVALWGALFFCVVFVSLYLMMETVSTSQRRFPDIDTNSLDAFEQKINEIQKDVVKNHDTIKQIKEAVRKLSSGDKESLEKLKELLNIDEQETKWKKPVRVGLDKDNKQLVATQVKDVEVSKDMCSWSDAPKARSDVQMLDLFDVLPFDNPDGGAWKQGWNVTYDHNEWNNKQLKVFVVAHSHTDPGWVKTFNEYYQQQTRNIFNSMLIKLKEDSRRKFIYAEISYFHLWWNELSADRRQDVKKLIESGQLEIVTGGWVMNDEANTHYFAMLDQMIEGHQWLNGTLGVKPTAGWAIDPFGHSPTMAYLLRRMGLNNMLIQRVHYSVKKHLSREKQLEFMWRQQWDTEATTDILCHMMPFYSYDIPHTCGPDPKICCQFDFRRLPGGRYNCPWNVPPERISPENVANRAFMLLDQYRKKAQLYRSNVLFVPLGDDFRYDVLEEWDVQFNNYQQLFDYMNSHSELGVHAQFGTLSDYFTALYKEHKVKAGQKPGDYPVLTGDFFTYSDRDDHYWSGYFTSRPFYKSLDRVLEYHLRAAEMIFSVAVVTARREKLESFPMKNLFEVLINARRNLGLFQHHDGITGTAKDFVVVDYGNRLFESLKDLKHVIKESATFMSMTTRTHYTFSKENPVFDVDETRPSHDSMPEKKVISVTDSSRPVMFYNSLGQRRQHVVRIYTDTAHVEIRDPENNIVPSQVDPFWKNHVTISDTIFKISFVVEVPALGFSIYTVKKDPSSNVRNVPASITVFNAAESQAFISSIFSIKKMQPSNFAFENAQLKAEFSESTGLLQTVTTKFDGVKHDAQIGFFTYGTKVSKERSGAYLFLPDGEAKPIPFAAPLIRIIQGPVLSEVHVMIDMVEHVTRLYNSSGTEGSSVEVYNIVDIKGKNNLEVAIRISTNVKNPDGVFYTDLNGFQIQKRKTYSKLPLQANFYPMPSMAFLEDDHYRFSVLTAQSLGVASQKQGTIEVMMDRTLSQDDGRGMGQGVLDNKRTPNKFWLLFEKRKTPIPEKSRKAAFSSLLGHISSLHLLHPLFVMPYHTKEVFPLHHRFSAVKMDLPCDIHFLNLRTMQNKDDDVTVRTVPKDTSALILHRLGVDCNFFSRGLMCQNADGRVALSSIFKEIEVMSATSMSLSLLYEEEEIETTAELNIQPMEIATYRVRLL